MCVCVFSGNVIEIFFVSFVLLYCGKQFLIYDEHVPIWKSKYYFHSRFPLSYTFGLCVCVFNGIYIYTLPIFLLSFFLGCSSLFLLTEIFPWKHLKGVNQIFLKGILVVIIHAHTRAYARTPRYITVSWTLLKFGLDFDSGIWHIITVYVHIAHTLTSI